ncbi:MAG TPA: SCO6880 family protein [Actinomycetota bacterium]|nr:SCO6880 family protein [Actinomycetota bacterium]
MRSYSDIRYRFGPLERRGLIGTLRPGQLLVLGATVLLTILLVETLRNGAGLALGALFLSSGGLASFAPFGGRTLNEWVPVVATFASRKLRGRDHWRSGAAEAGTRFLGGDIPVRPPDPIGRVELLAFPFRGVELGVLADRSNGTFTAVIQARARSFVLLDPEDKAQRLAGWANVIAGLAREGSPISRLQWLERTVPDDRNALNRYLRDALDPEIGLDALPLQSYLRLTQAAGPVTEQHELYIALQLNAGKAARAIKQAGGKDTGACMVLARELDTMARRLEQAEVEVLHALGPRRLAATIRLAYDPHARTNLARLASNDPSREDGVSARNAWPQRTRTHWSYYRTNDVVHSTYWIAEWPRIEVGPDFLAPLLVQTRCMRTVSVTMEPVPPLKAMRAVGFAKTADVADEELRQKLGFIGTAKRRNQAEAVARREQELADGHADVRFSGYITVTADDTDELSAACGEIEHAAGQCRLEIQRCDGEQDVSFTFGALPMCRGLK